MSEKKTSSVQSLLTEVVERLSGQSGLALSAQQPLPELAYLCSRLVSIPW